MTTLTNDAKVIVKFLKKYIFTRFGVPKAIINVVGYYFCNYLMEMVLKKYNMTHKIITSYHPQTSGQVDISNRELKSILQKIINISCKDWSIRLDDTL